MPQAATAGKAAFLQRGENLLESPGDIAGLPSGTAMSGFGPGRPRPDHTP